MKAPSLSHRKVQARKSRPHRDRLFLFSLQRNLWGSVVAAAFYSSFSRWSFRGRSTGPVTGPAVRRRSSRTSSAGLASGAMVSASVVRISSATVGSCLPVVDCVALSPYRLFLRFHWIVATPASASSRPAERSGGGRAHLGEIPTGKAGPLWWVRPHPVSGLWGGCRPSWDPVRSRPGGRVRPVRPAVQRAGTLRRPPVRA